MHNDGKVTEPVDGKSQLLLNSCEILINSPISPNRKLLNKKVVFNNYWNEENNILTIARLGDSYANICPYCHFDQKLARPSQKKGTKFEVEIQDD